MASKTYHHHYTRNHLLRYAKQSPPTTGRELAGAKEKMAEKINIVTK
jgi:hypothetical protein